MPTSDAQRLPSIDALRGIAILGILLMNVTSFAMPFDAYLDSRAYGIDAGANALLFRVERVFIAGKMLGLLSILFGAGVVLRSDATFASHARRMGVLLVIGMLHAYLVWYGDILFAYAIAGLIVFPLRRLPADGLLLIGGVALALVVFLAVVPLYGGMPAGSIAGELAAYRGAYVDQFASRVPQAVYAQTTGLIFYTLPSVVGLMCVGMGLTKLGMFDGRLSTRACLTFGAIACVIGWSITAATGTWSDTLTDEGGRLFVQTVLEPFVSAVVAAGYAALLMPLLRRWSPQPLVAVGRTALSCYLLQSLICSTIFYGHGLGWFGHVDRVGQLGVVAGVWLFLLIAAPLWLRCFRLGLAEWAWRRLARR